MTKTRPTSALALGVCLAATLAGCTQGTAPRNTIAQSETIPAISRPRTGLTQAAGPSLRGHDRSHWDEQRVVVRPDGSRAWFWHLHMQSRHDGDHPTALSSLEASPEFGPRELIGIPIRDAGAGVLFPFRAAPVLLSEDPPEQASAYERTRTGTWRDASAER